MAPDLPSLGMGRASEQGIRIGDRALVRLRLRGWRQQCFTCGGIDLEPLEADGNKATEQGEKQQGKEAANFHS